MAVHDPGAAPRLLATPGELRRESERWRAAGLSVGLVPTMGALHRGHRSLLRRARAECDRVAVSIFVNPRQFSSEDDLVRYPRTLSADLAVLAEEGADAALVPEAGSMYGPGFATSVEVGGPLTSTLEGACRPGHFAGVALVVAKLLIAARADRAYFGAKDAQQCAVVRRLAEDLDTGTEIVVCPTVRDADGLALSSRNVHLSTVERARALALPEGLAAAARLHAAGERDATALLGAAEAVLALAPGVEVEYVALVDPDSFEPVAEMTGQARILVAARIGPTRLIDTLCLGAEAPPTTAFDVGTFTSESTEASSTGRSRPCSVLS
jgi:pantoate--beta-alanine ligase